MLPSRAGVSIRGVEVRVLGPVELVGVDGLVPLGAPKLRRLLAAFAVDPGETRSVDVLVEALWEAPPATARKLLQLYVSQLRRSLPAGARIVTGADGYRLELPGGALDASRFKRWAAEGHAALADDNPELARSLLSRALSLWRGSAYGEFTYEQFCRPEVERLEELRLVATEERLEAELALGRHAELLPELRALAAAEPLRERLQGQMMVALYRCGRHGEALDLYQTMRAHLLDELGLEPGPALRELQRQILEHDPKLAKSARPSRAAATGLPTPPNRLLGRERELSELETLLVRDGVRLLVLTGAGGSGKTRLAYELAGRVAGSYANGVSVVELAALSDPAFVLPTIGRSLGLDRIGADPLQTLEDELRSRELLLVLDNAEHLPEVAPHYVELLARAPRMAMLVTSRAVLHLSGEHVYPVEPLPDAAAVELFIERARAAEPRLQPDPRIIGEICARVDRLPLAIELAAGHARTLIPEELLGRLERRLPLLAGGPHDLPARQLTLQATIDWSVGLLKSGERRDLARLAVFVGGCTLDAAIEICETNVDRVATLVDHSLLHRTVGSGGSRYTLLETVREHALAELDAADDAAEVRRRHAFHYGAVAEAANLNLEADGPMRHDLALRERDNLRAALSWTLVAGEIELGLRIATALENHWVTVAPYEGVRWLDLLLSHTRGMRNELHARALRARGSAAVICGASAEARSFLEESLRQYRRLGDSRGIGIVSHRLATFVLADGDIERARRLAAASLGHHRKVGFVKGEALGLGILGSIEQAAHRPDMALELYEQSLSLTTESGYIWWSARMLQAIAELLLDRGESAEAQSRLIESLPLLEQMNDRPQTLNTLALLARIAAARGDPEQAGFFWGAIEAEEARGPTGAWQTLRTTYAEDLLATAGPEFETGRTAGNELELTAALDLATRQPR